MDKNIKTTQKSNKSCKNLRKKAQIDFLLLQKGGNRKMNL